MSPRPFRPTVRRLAIAASSSLLLLLCLNSSIAVAASSGSTSVLRESFCNLDEIRLRCESTEYLLTIHGAQFTTDFDTVLNGTCSRRSQYGGGGELISFEEDQDGENQEEENLEICSEDIRLSINSQCAGATECVYNYSHHHIDKACSSSPGAITVEYQCVLESSILRFCNYPSSPSEGYISSPGYPSFYPSLVNCTWNITAGDGQTISMALLDYHLRPPRPYYGRNVCDEALSVYDGPTAAGTKLVSACGQSLQSLKTYESSGNSILVIFNSERFSPFRGFLLYYRARGCPTLPPPKDGYMVYRNGTNALYMCCKEHLFNDTLDNSRALHCVDGQQWNTTVPAACLSFEELRESGNYSDIDLIWTNNNTNVLSKPKIYKAGNDMLADIIIPSALMASLILGNIIVMIIILKIRRKNKDNDDFDDEEPPKPCSSTEPPNDDV